MKRIEKQVEPSELVAWKRRGQPGWQPGYVDLEAEPTGLKLRVRKALEVEQGYLCCYCMGRIPPCNIEHARPQSMCGPGEDIDYRNLMASCFASDGPRRVPASCNDNRGSRRLRVLPLQQDCEAHFCFSSDGHIRPAGTALQQEAARDSIAVLNLDNGHLVARRRAAIAGLGVADLTPEQRRKLIRKYALRHHGQFDEFAAALISVLAQWGL